MKKIITPMGLSLFTNFFKKNSSRGLKDDFDEFNDSIKYPASTYDKYKGELKELKTAVLNFAIKNEKASAEITSINGIVKEFQKKHSHETFTIYLLVSDTLHSVFAVQKKNQKQQISIENTNDLRTYIEGLDPNISTLNHTGPIKIKKENQTRKAFIFKYSPGGKEARLCYDVEIENKEIKAITIFDCVAGDFKHGKYEKYNYRKQFENFYGNYVERSEYHYLHILPKS